MHPSSCSRPKWPRARRRQAGRRAGIDHHFSRHALPGERAHGARSRAGRSATRGAEPATIAIIDGRIRIGLADDQLELLGHAPAGRTKVSRRDLPCVLASGALGATTVAGTMICAALAGIEVFVTGGIGGVHRGAQKSFDISADLQELARTSVAVVCAGVKSILDIGLTLEYLETHGVPVLACGQDDFAAFFTRDSGFKRRLPARHAAEQARFIRTKWQLGLAGGVVRQQAGAGGGGDAEGGDRRASPSRRCRSRARGITGKAVTPFLLARIKALTGGRSLATNIALVKNNAQVGARLAVALNTQPRITRGHPMSIDLKQLKYFLAVAEEKSFSRAAERLHISQPPLSQQIMKLESELGVRLFARTTRSFELTVAGKALMIEAADLLAQMRMTIDTIRQIDRGEVGRLRVGHRRLGDVGADPEPAGTIPDPVPARELDPARTGAERPVRRAARASRSTSASGASRGSTTTS